VLHPECRKMVLRKVSADLGMVGSVSEMGRSQRPALFRRRSTGGFCARQLVLRKQH